MVIIVTAQLDTPDRLALNFHVLGGVKMEEYVLVLILVTVLELVIMGNGVIPSYVMTFCVKTANRILVILTVFRCNLCAWSSTIL